MTLTKGRNDRTLWRGAGGERRAAAGQILTEIMANLHHKLPFIERYSRPEAGFFPFLTMLGAHKGSLRSLSSSRVSSVYHLAIPPPIVSMISLVRLLGALRLLRI